MGYWIDEQHHQLWEWIVECDPEYEKCSSCPLKEPCDGIWEIVKEKEQSANKGMKYNV